MKTSRAQNITSLVKEVGKHPAVYGYYLRDEPTSVFSRPRESCRANPRTRSRQMGLHQFVSRLRQRRATRREQLRGIHREIYRHLQTNRLSYDNYSLMDDGSLRDGYWQNLEAMRNASVKHKIPFWNIVLSVAHFNYREPSAADLRFEVYTTLAYGGKGIAYFCYFAPQVGNYRGAPIDQFGNETQSWQWMQNVNLQVAKLAPTLLQLTSDDVYHLGDVPAAATRLARKVC